MKIRSLIVAVAVVLFTSACGGGDNTSGGSGGTGDTGDEGNQNNNNPQVLTLNAIGRRIVTAGENLNFTVSAANPNGGTLFYSVTYNAGFADPFDLADANDATFNMSGNAIFDWSTAAEDSGSYELQFTVENSNGESDSETVLIVVEETSGQYITGESSYIGSCQRCHGPRGSGASNSPIHCIDSAYFFEMVNSGGDMSGYASGWSNVTKNAVLFYLGNVNPAVCYL